MANLSQLKFAMATSIFLSAFIFSVLVFAVVFFLELDLFTGLLIAIGGSALFILFQYAIGPAIVAATTKLHYLKPGENPWLESMVKELADKSGIPMPKLATVPNNTPNAFTFGRTTRSATLAVHDGLLRSLNKGEIEAVIAHELGHIKHKDYVVMTILSALPLIAYLIAQFALRAGMISSMGSRRRNQKEGNVGAALVIIGVISFVIYILTFLVVMRLSRLREHYADAFSAYLTGSPHGLQSALAKITYGLSISPKAPEGARAFYIGDPATAKREIQKVMSKKDEYDLDNDGVLNERELNQAMEREASSTWVQMNSLFATHPPTFKRIQLLREIEKEMATGTYASDKMYAHV
ncbi:MAG: zinc metalloprotease HtpX [Candidatus Bathyarchaeota archaeon]|nr:zinc metalloprotease HtpX [Candidatus Bathyarchaeota archaeon]